MSIRCDGMAYSIYIDSCRRGCKTQYGNPSYIQHTTYCTTCSRVNWQHRKTFIRHYLLPDNKFLLLFTCLVTRRTFHNYFCMFCLLILKLNFSHSIIYLFLCYAKKKFFFLELNKSVEVCPTPHYMIVKWGIIVWLYNLCEQLESIDGYIFNAIEPPLQRNHSTLEPVNTVHLIFKFSQ